MEYRKITEEEMTMELFNGFERYQKVTTCKRKIDGEWKLVEDPFIDQWTKEEYQFLVQCLRHTIATEGVVYGAFERGRLIGFASVESEPLGSEDQYRDLTSIHVSLNGRGMGIGRKLFGLAADWARQQGGQKLYISAHSAIESQKFYEAMGCVEAVEYSQKHVEEEPCDCQLEYCLETKCK